MFDSCFRSGKIIKPIKGIILKGTVQGGGKLNGCSWVGKRGRNLWVTLHKAAHFQCGWSICLWQRCSHWGQRETFINSNKRPWSIPPQPFICWECKPWMMRAPRVKVKIKNHSAGKHTRKGQLNLWQMRMLSGCQQQEFWFTLSGGRDKDSTAQQHLINDACSTITRVSSSFYLFISQLI